MYYVQSSLEKKQSSGGVLQKRCFQKFRKIHRKHLCQSPFFNKVDYLLKKRPCHKCFPVNLAKFLKTPFLQNISNPVAASKKKLGKATQTLKFRRIILIPVNLNARRSTTKLHRIYTRSTISSLIRQKDESLKGAYKKTKHAKFSEKLRFSENLESSYFLIKTVLRFTLFPSYRRYYHFTRRYFPKLLQVSKLLSNNFKFPDIYTRSCNPTLQYKISMSSASAFVQNL